MPALAENPAFFDAEADFLRTLTSLEEAFTNNPGAVVQLHEGSDLLVGNVPALAQYGAPSEADAQRVRIHRTAQEDRVTYSLTVHSLDHGIEVGPTICSSFFNGFDVKRLFKHTEDHGMRARFWAENAQYSRDEGLLAALAISGENAVVESVQQEAPAAERELRQRRFARIFRLPGMSWVSRKIGR